MRQAKRWRYYCDHCRKAGGSKGHMVAHERGCTGNPDRVCRICELAGFTPKPLAELVELCASLSTMRYGGPEGEEEYGSLGADGLAKLRDAAGGCPVCTFAAMRQSKCFPSVDFKLKDELAPVWEDINERRESAEAGYG